MNQSSGLLLADNVVLELAQDVQASILDCIDVLDRQLLLPHVDPLHRILVEIPVRLSVQIVQRFPAKRRRRHSAVPTFPNFGNEFREFRLWLERDVLVANKLETHREFRAVANCLDFVEIKLKFETKH